MSTETETPTEDVVAKYKRLLSLARSSLEANQATLAAKDRHISQLLLALEEEKTHRSHRRVVPGKDDEAHIPRNLLRRVNVDDVIWILVEYEGADDGWINFSSESDLIEFVQRIPGVPLEIPQCCLSPNESAKIEAEAKRKVERIVEEFRRFKVRTEIDRKSREAEMRVAAMRGSPSISGTVSGTATASSGIGSGSGTNLPALLEKSMAEGINNTTPASSSSSSGTNNISSSSAANDSEPGGYSSSSRSEEVQRIRAQLGDQDVKWRQAYEKVVKENEILRARGGEAILATQWRERYENSQREKDELAEKLKIYSKATEGAVMSGGSFSLGGGGEKSLEQSYADLKEEYNDFRRRVLAVEKHRRNSAEPDRFPPSSLPQSQPVAVDSSTSTSMMSYGFDSQQSQSQGYGQGQGQGQNQVSQMGGSMGARTLGMGESKVQYIRHMVLQYLSCKDAVVKPHIESALVAMFRYNEAERVMIEERRKEESADTISSITSFIESSTPSFNFFG